MHNATRTAPMVETLRTLRERPSNGGQVVPDLEATSLLVTSAIGLSTESCPNGQDCEVCVWVHGVWWRTLEALPPSYQRTTLHHMERNGIDTPPVPAWLR